MGAVLAELLGQSTNPTLAFDLVFPEEMTELRDAAAVVAHQCLDHIRASCCDLDPAALAERLEIFAFRMSRIGRSSEAVSASREAVTLRRGLASVKGAQESAKSKVVAQALQTASRLALRATARGAAAALTHWPERSTVWR
jgi:hypothetical protein